MLFINHISPSVDDATLGEPLQVISICVILTKVMYIPG